MGVCWRRIHRRAREMEHIQQAITRLDAKVRQLDSTLALLEARLAQFLQDNAQTGHPCGQSFAWTAVLAAARTSPS